MNELIQFTENIFTQYRELSEVPGVKGAVSKFFSWASNKLFANKKATQEKLALVEQQNADEQTISDLMTHFRFVLDGNEDLQKELLGKIEELDLILKQTGVQTCSTNTVSVDNHSKKENKAINGSTLNDNSINQQHNGSGDNVGGNKIIRK